MTTQRYMHLSPQSADKAIRLLDEGRVADIAREEKEDRGDATPSDGQVGESKRERVVGELGFELAEEKLRRRIREC